MSKIQLSGTDKSVGTTNDLKQPNMTMNPDLKDDTKFELFGSSANLSDIPNISTNVSKIQLSGTDKSVGTTNNLKQPNMTMNPDLKDNTKFELFGSEKNTNNISSIIAIFLLIIFLIILYFL